MGTGDGGRELAWNLVEGLHDGPERSERAVWVDGVPRAVGPVGFAADLSAVGGLVFTPEATRERHEHRVLLSSDYVQPFGTASGVLPGGGPAARGLRRHGAPPRALVSAAHGSP